MQDFVPGQRWLSETQGELGLGLVELVDPRTVQIAFPAAAERRTYAREGAPLWRAAFTPGEAVRDLDGHDITVTAVEERDGLLTYRGHDSAGTLLQISERVLDPHLRLNRPRQKLLAGRLDPDTWFRLRHQCHAALSRWAATPARGLVGARVSPIPHQLFIAAEVADRYAPRVLLADEVGLGKTIEAGLILHRMLLAGRARRVLILVPDALLHQWLVEMLRRFNLRFALFDRARFDAAAQANGGANPFQTEQRVLCSLDLLAGAPAIARAALAGDWDLLVVDEAHHLHWTPEESSLRYDLVEAMARLTPGVLLLSATPEQLGRAGHFGRLRLLDPQRFEDYSAFLREEADYAPVASIATHLLEGRPLTPEQQVRLAALLGDTAGLPPGRIIERLLDRHGTGRVLFRNTRAAIPGFPARRAKAYPLALPEALGRPGPAGQDAPVQDWMPDDPRVRWLVETLRALRPAKVLAICAEAEGVLALRGSLRQLAGIHAAVFHEGMEIVERDRAAAYFADRDEGAQLLICSEIGSEGRNFQFAHHLILLDLPLDPDLLEQRIGRLDRIGQTETVEIHVPYLQGSTGETLYHWYARGLDAFNANCPAGAAVYERLGERLRAALRDQDRGAGDTARHNEALIAEAARLRQHMNRELEAGRDRLLELNSHRADTSARLVNAVYAQDCDHGLRDWITGLWDAFGVEHEAGAGGATVLRPGEHMLQERFPGLPDDGLTLSFERAHALAHEERAFLTWEHPMVRAAIDLVTGSDLGTSVVILTRDPRFATGTVLLEQIRIAECPAPTELQVERFLPPTLLRTLIDEQGRDRAAEITEADLFGRCLTGNRKLARSLIRAKAARIAAMLSAGESAATAVLDDLRAHAIRRMQQMLDAKIERLRALAKVNPSVRAEELAYLGMQRERLQAALAHVRLRLDALRLVAFA